MNKEIYEIPKFNDIYDKAQKNLPLNPVEKYIYQHGFYARNTDENYFRQSLRDMLAFLNNNNLIV